MYLYALPHKVPRPSNPNSFMRSPSQGTSYPRPSNLNSFMRSPSQGTSCARPSNLHSFIRSLSQAFNSYRLQTFENLQGAEPAAIKLIHLDHSLHHLYPLVRLHHNLSTHTE